MIIKINTRQQFPRDDPIRIGEGISGKIETNTAQYHDYVTTSGTSNSYVITNGFKTTESETIQSTA